VSVQLPAIDEANPEIERMWAWQKIDRLLKEADQAGSRTGAIDEIVRLGEGYSIVTEYTSFIVLENDAEYQRWKIQRRNVVRLARDRKQQEVLQAELARIRDKSLADLGPNTAEANRPASSQPAVTTTVPGTVPQVAQPVPTSGRNLDFRPSLPGGGGGGGAIDPVSGTIVLALAGLGFATGRRRKSPTEPTKGGE
jgi:Ca-activated chloride channel homolog